MVTLEVNMVVVSSDRVQSIGRVRVDSPESYLERRLARRQRDTFQIIIEFRMDQRRISQKSTDLAESTRYRELTRPTKPSSD